MHEAYYADAFDTDDTHHWWYRARRHILRSVVSGIALPQGVRIMDVGAGTGSNLYSIFPEHTERCGIEPSEVLATLAQRKGPIPVYPGSAESIPPPRGWSTL